MGTLPEHAFRREDESPDPLFYREARFVTHIDEPAIAAVTALYRDHFAPDSAVLDLMSSWVSHLPQDIRYGAVVGLGLNAEELAANPQLDLALVQDLNATPALPFRAGAFDGVALCVSVQYLTKPVEVFREIARVLKPGAPLVVTFSNRCFPTKAVLIWRALDGPRQAQLVVHYLDAAGGFVSVALLDRSPPAGDPLFAVVAHTEKARI